MTDNGVTKMERPEAQPPADPMVSMIERVVLNPDADLDKLERMLAMRERMEAQTARISFARALSQARAAIPPIVKDATVDYTAKGSDKRTHYKHETLAGIARAIDPILAEHGLSYRFRTEQGNGGVRVTCIVQHSDGHSEETSLAGAPDGSGSKNSFQAVGSAVTYLQRYTLKAALGLSAEVDDDGQGAAPRDHAPRQQAAGPSKEEVDAACARLADAPDLDALRARWSDIARQVQSVPAVIAAKDARKAELDKPAEPNAESLADQLGDEIPYQ